MSGGRLGVMALLIVSLAGAGAARVLAEHRRAAIVPIGGSSSAALPHQGRATLGQLNSFTLTLLLGGLRGPLVMALWSSSEEQRSLGEMEDFDTKIELIRLLQPQFATVHLYQIWNKAYNVSAQMSTMASKYGAILDAIDYAQRVLAERPGSIDMETQLGEIYNNKLGGSQESDYYAMRVREETQADEPAVRITFPASREAEFGLAALAQGVGPRQLLVRRTGDVTTLTAVIGGRAAAQLRDAFSGEGVTYEQLAPRQAGARGVSGPLRLEPMLDEEGNLLPWLITPTRPPPPGAEPGTYLDGSRLQFLRDLGPFPNGLMPQALAYNHFMKAHVLQNHAGQRHVNRSESFVNANPGRALRDWALRAFDEGRMLEAEALGDRPTPPGIVGEYQAALERASAQALPTERPLSPAVYHDAMEYYRRADRMAEMAADWLSRHLQQYPEEIGTFGSTVRRMEDMQVLLEGDLAYAELVSATAEDREAARQRAIAAYTQAYGRLLDFVMEYHTPTELLPDGLERHRLMQQPLEVKWQIFENLLRVRDASEGRFDHGRAVTEFEGYFDRIRTRLAILRGQTEAA